MICNYNIEQLDKINYAERNSVLKDACIIEDATWKIDDIIAPPSEIGDNNMTKILCAVYFLIKRSISDSIAISYLWNASKENQLK